MRGACVGHVWTIAGWRCDDPAMFAALISALTGTVAMKNEDVYTMLRTEWTHKVAMAELAGTEPSVMLYGLDTAVSLPLSPQKRLQVQC